MATDPNTDGLPCVSVLVPVYEAERYLDETLGSVCSQSFSSWEVVAVDDCSRDQSHELLVRWASREPRIRVFRNAINLGMTRNWNRCLEASQGDLILKLDADDVLRPDALRILYEALCPADVIGAGVRTLQCTEDLSPFDGIAGDDAMMQYGIDPYRDHDLSCARWYEIAARGHQLWTSCAVLLRRDAVVNAGGFDERFGCASDTALIWRLLEGEGRFSHRAYVGLYYRKRPGSVSHRFRENGWLGWEGVVANLITLDRFRRHRPLSRALRMRYVDLWKSWQDFVACEAFGRLLSDSIRHNLLDAMQRVSPPCWSDRTFWGVHRYGSRLVR